MIRGKNSSRNSIKVSWVKPKAIIQRCEATPGLPQWIKESPWATAIRQDMSQALHRVQSLSKCHIFKQDVLREMCTSSKLQFSSETYPELTQQMFSFLFKWVTWRFFPFFSAYSLCRLLVTCDIVFTIFRYLYFTWVFLFLATFCFYSLHLHKYQYLSA